MQSYNIFDALHKGVQSLLSDTTRILQKTAFGNSFEAGITINHVNRFVQLFNDLAWLEETWLFPRLTYYTPATVFVLEQDHRDIRAALQRLKSIMNVYHQSVTTEEKEFTGTMLVNVFTELMILVLRHFSKEENMVNTILWRHCSNTEMAELEQEMIACVPTEDLVLYTNWANKNIGPDKLHNWLYKLEAGNALQQFHELTAYAELELSVIQFPATQAFYSEQMLVA